MKKYSVGIQNFSGWRLPAGLARDLGKIIPLTLNDERPAHPERVPPPPTAGGRVEGRAGRSLKARRVASKGERAFPAELTFRFVGDREMTVLNRQYKKHDRTTDVLAFETGDIAISVETAARQSRALGHSLRRELLHLSTHALLHLLGHRDKTAAGRRAMDRATEVILDSLTGSDKTR